MEAVEDRTLSSPRSIQRRKTLTRSPLIKEQELGAHFKTDWNLGGEKRCQDGKVVGKRKRIDAAAVASGFPLKLDSKGKARGLVQRGPVTTKRVQC